MEAIIFGKQVLAGALISTLLALSGCTGLASDSKPHTVRYVVEYGPPTEDGRMLVYDGVARADITYANEGGGISQDNGVTLSWSKTFTARRGAFLSVSAQIVSQFDAKVVAVRIFVDDVQVKISESSGRYAIASASGVL